MSRGLNLNVQVGGIKKAEDRYRGVVYRLTHAQPAFQKVERILEAGERRHFAGLRGKYIRTGATMASLTQPTANNAIRHAHNDELIFGSSVWYAKFLRVGKVTKRGTRRSAVLVLKPTERKQANRAILDFIVGGDSRES